MLWHRGVLSGPALAALVVAGCSDPPRRIAWEFVFGDAALRDRARVVEVAIRRGGCDAEPLYEAALVAGDVAPPVPDLTPGRYHLTGVALDADCVAYASICSAQELPGDVDSLLLVLEADARGPRCAIDACDEGRCAPSDGGADAGADAAWDVAGG